MTRRMLRFMARGLIGCLLFMQLAVAAYACPAVFEYSSVAELAPTAEPAVDLIAEAAVTAAAESNRWLGGQDPASANLCAEHCKSGQQSDKAPTIVVPVLWLTPRYLATPPAEPSVLPRVFGVTASALMAAAPSHAILHCVRRT